MNDIIFEQDKRLKRPYTAKALLNRASNPRLASPLPSIDRGHWLLHPLKKRMARPQIINKVAKELGITLEERDGLFVFRFPDVCRPKDVQDMQERVLEGIAFFESQGWFVEWLKELPGNFVAGLCFLFGVSRKECIEMPRGGQSNAATLTLMKSIERDIIHRDIVNAGITLEEASKALALCVNAGKITLRPAEKTDERYDEPIACYPTMEAM